MFVGLPIETVRLAQPPPAVSQLNAGPLVAVAAGQTALATNFSVPGNAFLYDVSVPAQPVRVGAVSVTQSVTQSGFALRLAMKDKFLYASTFLQGLQKIDLQQAITDYQQAQSDPSQLATLGQEGQGFAIDSIVNTIPLALGQATATMWDLKADDFVTGTTNSNGVATQTLLVATGQLPLVVADPDNLAGTSVLYPPAASGSLVNQPLQMTNTDGTSIFLLCSGRAVAVGTLAQTDNQGNSSARHVAVVVGLGAVVPVSSAPSCAGTSTIPAPTLVPMLAVVDISQPYTPGSQSSNPVGSPFNPQPIGFVPLVDQNGNAVGGTDITLYGNVALVATGTNVLLVNLENPAQPTLAGQISGSFGNWLGLTDTGFLLGTSPASSSGSILTADLGTYPFIRHVFPPLARVDDSSTSADPVSVTYSIPSTVQPGTTGELDWTRDGNVLASYPLGQVQPGTFTKTVPAGVFLDVPPMDVQITVASAGQTTAPFSVPIRDPNDPVVQAANLASSAPSATFGLLSPSQAVTGSGDTTVTITGSGMNQIAQVYVQSVDGTWVTLNTSSNKPTSAQITIPGSMLVAPGFLEISPVESGQLALAFLAFTPGLPTLNTAPTMNLASVAPIDIGSGGSVEINGGPFTQGMNLVLGRSNTPGIVLSTTFDADSVLEAALPQQYIAAQDLFIAVLSADGQTLSRPVPIASTFPVDEPDSQAPSQPDDPFSIQAVNGNLIWNARNQEIEVEGAGLQAGMTVTFTTSKGSYTAVAEAETATLLLDDPSPAFGVGGGPSPLPDPPQSGSPTSDWLSRIKVKVPDQLTQLPAFAWIVKLFGGNQQPPVTSPPVKQPPQRNYNVYLGAISTFRAFYDPVAADVHVAQVGGGGIYGPLSESVSMQELTKDQIVWSLTQNPIPHAAPVGDGIPTVLQEIPSNPDPAAFYLRAMHLTTSTTVTLHLQATVSTTSGPKTIQKDVNVAVVKGRPTGKEAEDDIVNEAADNFGIPPQFLVAQAIQEGHFLGKNVLNFRYEPLTVDLANLSGGASENCDQNSGKRWIEDDPIQPYVIGGNILNMVNPPGQCAGDVQKAATPLVVLAKDTTTATPSFSLGGAVIGFQSGNRDPNATPRVTVTLTDPQGKAEVVNRVYSTYTWIKGGSHCGNFGPSACSQNSTYFGVATPPSGSGPNNGPGGNEYAIDYGTGNVTFGRQLQAGETLTLNYYLVSANRYTVSGGNPSLDLTSGKIIKPALQGLKFTPNDTLSSWFVNNMQKSNDINYQFGIFLTGTPTEKALKFVATRPTDVPSGHAQPTTTLDGRFSGATAQFYAASSYGIIQVLVRTLADGTYGLPLQNALSDASVFPNRSMFDTLTSLKAGFSLGAAYHRVSIGLIDTDKRTATKPHRCGVPGAQIAVCTTKAWTGMWSSTFYLYNAGGNGYSGVPIGIIVNGQHYEPK